MRCGRWREHDRHARVGAKISATKSRKHESSVQPIDMGLITNYNLRSIAVRKATAAMTAGGIAMVVAVFVMTLAIAQGFRATLVASGSPGNAIVLRKGATAETVSAVLRPDVPII